ncbi:family 78 glycoside hydrolase catalytic domain [Paenibacillus sp. LHD-38]|uniref:family 78 glycoside hydrolase catalytic domain n=1 Tax=Paenibacillus sp. LHD-38 TaxID=3072143 RepID=UPI00280C517B|nr:family 78 glycoside hydrolase catalytic domain [Paenibacillus sp. LHD-38]MDQ8734400.1 family 78 glycoside hydrolase catalytic domain [Paenibacillus sp. LHD-38]
MVNNDWNASWIWGGEAVSPRNEWRCFRKSFVVDQSTDGITSPSNTTLRISADSRYVLYINGKQVGRGPVRSWTVEQFYDVYEVGHLLVPGQVNTIAVLVLHFGVSTFYYLRGRGGLLVQLDSGNDTGTESKTLLATDETWNTSVHEGYHTRSPRMSCQQGFSEYVDAGLWGEDWIETAYQDARWEKSKIIGPVGTGPWTTLLERDIPLLAEYPVYPSRILTLNSVQSFTYSTAIDMRNQMVEGSEEHANVVGFTGYAATVLCVSEETEIILGFPNAGECVGSVSLNGVKLGEDRFTGVLPERYAAVTLSRGDNLLLIDVSGQMHTGKLHLGIFSDVPVELRAPLIEAAEQQGASAFITIGPFDSTFYLDHQQSREIDFEDQRYREVIDKVASIDDLIAYSSYIRSIDESYVSEADVFGLSIWKKESISRTIPTALQNALIPNASAGVIPVYPGLDTEIVIDFSKELTGYLSFEVEAEAGTILDFYGFEYMTEDYRQDTYGLDNTLRYVCKEGRQRYVSPIRRGLRYLMLTVRNAVKPVKLINVHYMANHYPVAEIGRFQCSDPLLNDIWEISRHTTKLCMEDTFVDCPAYEQVFWVGDSRNEALVSNYLFGVNDIVKRCLRLVPGSKDQTPLYADQVPSGWSSVIPNWTFFWAIACREYVEQTADLSFAKEMYPHIRFTLEHYLKEINEDGLLAIKGWNLLDWSPIDQPNDGIVTHQNCFLVKTLRVASEMAVFSGDAEGQRKFAQAADDLQAAINAHLWSEEQTAYLDCIHVDSRRSDIFSVQTQVVAYLTGVAQGGRRSVMERYLLDSPAHFVQIGSPFMSFFYYEALSESGQVSTIVDDIRHNYGQMIEHDATTCWEMYPNFSENRANPNMLTRSHCHAWSSAPAYFLGREVLGIRSSAIGWSEVDIMPNPCGLTWAKGSVPLSDSGRIDVSWKLLAEQVIEISVHYPESVKVNIKIPEGYQGIIREKKSV